MPRTSELKPPPGGFFMPACDGHNHGEMMILKPFRYGATARAYVMAALMALVAVFAFAPHAHADSRHHWQHWHGHHHHARHAHYGLSRLAAHHRHRIAIDVRTGAVEAVDLLSAMGSLFRPPAAVAETSAAVAQASIEQGIAVAGATPAAIGSFGRRGYAAVAAAARRMGVPVSLALAEAKQESGGNCRAHSWAGARGVLQVEPYTARKDGFDPARLYDCEYGAAAGMTELAHLIAADGGVTCHAISRYYGSDAYLRRFRGGCAPYGRQVLARMHAIERAPTTTDLMMADWPAPRRHHRHRRRWA